MKKLSTILGAMLMLGSMSTFATCPTVAQCYAVSDGYGRYQCLQQANNCPAAPICTEVKGVCTVEPSRYCDNVTDLVSRSMCLYHAPKTVTVCAPDTQICN